MFANGERSASVTRSRDSTEWLINPIPLHMVESVVATTEGRWEVDLDLELEGQSMIFRSELNVPSRRLLSRDRNRAVQATAWSMREDLAKSSEFSLMCNVWDRSMSRRFISFLFLRLRTDVSLVSGVEMTLSIYSSCLQLPCRHTWMRTREKQFLQFYFAPYTKIQICVWERKEKRWNDGTHCFLSSIYGRTAIFCRAPRSMEFKCCWKTAKNACVANKRRRSFK